jgi:nucleoside-diphosphate-sugar epimerase
MNPIIQSDLEVITNASLPWSYFSGATILVTGASGFLPAYMVETLLHLNRIGILDTPCHVVALARNYQRARERFIGYNSSDLDLLIQDVSQPITLPYKFDYIIHAASQASPVYYKIDPVGTLSANSTGTRVLLDLARTHPCRGFLFFSSGDVYGDVSHFTRPVRETDFGAADPLNPRSCYGESKRMGETLCAAFTHQHRIPTKIVRIAHTYGPGMRLDDGRIFADFTRDILAGGPLKLHSDGTAQRPFLYLSDATVAFFTVLLKGASAEAYNVANPSTIVSIGELADRLASLFHLSVERPQSPVGSHSSIYIPATIPGVVPSIEKMKNLGWEPTTGIEEGFTRTVESYR